MQLLNLDNLGVPIKFKSAESISTFKTLIEILEKSDFIKVHFWSNSFTNIIA